MLLEGAVVSWRIVVVSLVVSVAKVVGTGMVMVLVNIGGLGKGGGWTLVSAGGAEFTQLDAVDVVEIVDVVDSWADSLGSAGGPGSWGSGSDVGSGVGAELEVSEVTSDVDWGTSLEVVVIAGSLVGSGS
jgi:hypothetical protein